jgi:hypothetical protein
MPSARTIGYRYAKGKPEVVRAEGISSGGDRGFKYTNVTKNVKM